MSERTTAAPAAAVAPPPPAPAAPGPHAPPGGAAPRSTPARPRRRGRRAWTVVGVLAAAFVVLAVRGLGGSLDYFETVDQALQHRALLGTTTFRLEGVVVPGTVHRTREGVSFEARGTVHRVAVVNHGSPPQLFQPDIPVVVVGHFAGRTFVSDQVIVDHSAQYVQQHPDRVRAPDGTVR